MLPTVLNEKIWNLIETVGVIAHESDIDSR